MEDQEGHLGVVDQCLQMSTGIGAGMSPIHHRGSPEVQHILRISTLEEVKCPGAEILMLWQ